MSRIGFSDKEMELVELYARDKFSVRSRLGFYASVLVPVLIFGGFGIVQRDFLAYSVALVGLLIVVWWRPSAEFAHIGIHRSIFQKVLAHEKVTTDDPTQDPP